MNANEIRSIQDITPFGIGYLKLPANGPDKIEDYILLDINPAFEKLTGWTREHALNKRVSEIFDNTGPGEFSWLLYFENAVRSGKTQESVQWIGALQQYLKITAIPSHQSLMVVLQGASEEWDSSQKEETDPLPEKELLRITLQSIGDGVVTTDNHGMITSLNLVAQELTGWENSTAVGRPFTEIVTLKNENTGQPAENPVQKVLETGRILGLANHTELISRYGRCIPITDSAAPIKTEDGQTKGVVMVFRDVSEEKEHSKQIEFLSYHDHLTGLYNRRYIEGILEQLDKAENLPISIIMGDVNGLKLINDVFGLGAGDILLKRVASLLTKHCRKEDFIARCGSDEFVVIMPRADLKEAEEVIRQLKGLDVTIAGANLSLSLSFGCSSKNSMESNIQVIMKNAEEYMCRQKLLDGKSNRNATISALLAALYEKSNETEEHSKRIEEYCHAIGRKLQLSNREMDDLSLLALLHDIGKVSIDSNILQKPGALTPEEWEEMKRHPEIGFRIAQATPELAIAADFILSHHERWDGKGYPRGLKGEKIPLICRILAVVDAFDAMTNDRVYRRAMTIGEAADELERNAGSQFDPRIAGLLIEMIINKDK